MTDRGAAKDGAARQAPQERWRGFVARHRGRLHVAGVAVSVFILALSLFFFARTLATLSWRDLVAAIRSTGWDQIALAAGFTALSYFFLTGYDALALRQLKLRVPYPQTALASFTSYAISFTLGFPLVTGGAVRYWIYSQASLSAGKVASLTVIAGVTFWLGMALVVGAALALDPVGMAEIDQLKIWVNALIGWTTLGTIGAYLVWVSRGRRRARIQGLRLELPGFSLTLGQMAISVADLAAAAGALYALLPRGADLDYPHFLATYVMGCLLGVASNAPGGLGAFEMTMLKAVSAPSQEGLLASLLLFRGIYYIGPFLLALALLGAREGVRRWTALRDAMNVSSEDEEA